MARYTKPWLSIEQQVARLRDHGLLIPDEAECVAVLSAVGYYRLSGYLYPFRESEAYTDETGRERVRVLSTYRPGTNLQAVFQLIAFDRALRLLVLEATEHIEVSLRMRLGYVLGESSAFAHLEYDTFLTSFTDTDVPQETTETLLHVAQSLFPGGFRSKHQAWIDRVEERRRSASDESFVSHFARQYDNQLPIWALTEILEFGHLSRLYGGLSPQFAIPIAEAYMVPNKKLMLSWLASLNYTRNVAAHHARLFNRKLQSAPARPKRGAIPVLDHLTSAAMPKTFGVYSILAVMAYLLKFIQPTINWSSRLVELAESFPEIEGMDLGVVGFPPNWREEPLWA